MAEWTAEQLAGLTHQVAIERLQAATAEIETLRKLLRECVEALTDTNLHKIAQIRKRIIAELEGKRDG